MAAIIAYKMPDEIPLEAVTPISRCYVIPRNDIYPEEVYIRPIYLDMLHFDREEVVWYIVNNKGERFDIVEYQQSPLMKIQ